MPDSFESHLRDVLTRRADTFTPEAPAGSRSVVNAAHEARARRHRRRMAATSVATVAAVGSGLVLIARDPGTQPVRTKRAAASDVGSAPDLAAGAATGSSTGSATGSPTGWTSTATDGGAIPQDDPGVAYYVVHPGDGYRLISAGVVSTEQGRGLPAADLAVAAELVPGATPRFVVASVQDANRLSPGKGGNEVTIAGRSGRIISRRAATTMTWDVSDTKRALVYFAGVDSDTLQTMLASLAPGPTGQWGFSGSAGGLALVATTTPRRQITRSQTWQQVEAPGQPELCMKTGYSLDVTTGGAYELWGSLADQLRWDLRLPTVVQVPNGTDLSLAFESPDHNRLVVEADSDTVLRVDHWSSDGREHAPLVDTFATLVRPSSAEEWAALQSDDPGAASACRAGRQAGVAKDLAGIDPEAPAASAPPATMTADEAEKRSFEASTAAVEPAK